MSMSLKFNNAIADATTILNESKTKWITVVKVKGGKMRKALDIPEGKNISDIYKNTESDAKRLVDDLSKKIKNKRELTSMIAFVANINKGVSVFDRALSYLKEIE